MDYIISDLYIPLEKDGTGAYLQAAAKQLNMEIDRIVLVKILSKAIDFRNPEQFFVKVTIVIRLNEGLTDGQNLLLYTEPAVRERKAISLQDRPIIVGFGPAGMFAALEFLAHGIRPLIFERGKKIEERSSDMQGFIQTRELNPESNVQFGEGGAGSYSDGKLFSRRNNNSGHISQVLRTFIKFGAPAEIEFISKPHLGTDCIRKIVKNIRHSILHSGGTIHYNAKMTDILIREGKAAGIIINGQQEYLSSSIFIAAGHSARDTLEMMHAKGIALERKPISAGIRIEHPAALINRMRYGLKYQYFNSLGAATYSLNYTNRTSRRGVYTFCMCPGGEVLNASSSQGRLVVNGMSYSQRSSPFSNAALVVNCQTDDYPPTGPLAGLDFQRDIEKKAFASGGGNWRVPAQNLMDFLEGKTSLGVPENSCRMGVTPADMREILPPFIVNELLAAFQKWQDQIPLFVTDQALLLAAETRTSSPVRVMRNNYYESVNTKNIFPIGEGSGYTGGITSSAADAIRAVEAFVLRQ